MIFLADALTDAQATWIITGLGSIGFMVAIAVGLKKLFWEKKLPQPVSVTIDKALEDKFLAKPEFEKFEKYVHKSHHDFSEKLQAVVSSGDDRNEVLVGLVEASKHTAQTVETIARRTEEIEKTKYRDGKDVHDRINDVLKAVSKLEGNIDQMNRRTR